MARQADIPTDLALPQAPISQRALNLVQAVLLFFRRFPVGAIAGVVLLVIGVVAGLAGVFAPHDPLFVDFLKLGSAPSAQYLLGTDYEGRDILSRIIYGGRVSLQVSVLSVLLGSTIGGIWGVTSAFLGGRFDIISQRLVEIVMSFPALVLAMVLLVALGGGIWTVIVAIAVTRLPYGVRVVRSVALSVKELTYVDAARAMGAFQLPYHRPTHRSAVLCRLRGVGYRPPGRRHRD